VTFVQHYRSERAKLNTKKVLRLAKETAPGTSRRNASCAERSSVVAPREDVAPALRYSIHSPTGTSMRPISLATSHRPRLRLPSAPTAANPQVEIKTSMGSMTSSCMPTRPEDGRQLPHVRQGEYYNGTIFHRVIPAS
jgi:hypothetical protein